MWSKPLYEQAKPYDGKYQLQMKEIGACVFIFWKVIFKNTMVLHTLQKQSNMNKEVKGERTFWKPESFILYLFK